MRFLAVIPARGGSKGVPRKNIRILCGRPLIAYSIDAALKSGVVERLVVSTEDEEIAGVSLSLGAEVVARPPDLASDEAPTLPVLQHVVATLGQAGHRPDAIITLQPTSPLRTGAHVAEAVRVFEADSKAESLVSCQRVPHAFHPESLMTIGADGYLRFLSSPSRAPKRRQEKEPLFARNGAAIYITRVESLDHFVYGGRCIPYLMAPDDSLDIDTEEDFRSAERILAARTISGGA